MIYNVGKEENKKYYDHVSELADYDYSSINKDEYQWIVYAYYLGSWEGGGDFVGLKNNGQLIYINLCHCSCYGPIEEHSEQVIAKDEFIGDKLSYREIDPGVFEKVVELLQDNK